MALRATAAACLCLLALPGLALGAARLTDGSTSVLRAGLDSGGGAGASATVLARHSIGQAGVFASQGGTVRLAGGAGPLFSQPGSVVSISAVTKSTGTLDLDWLAPGGDGQLGAVANGWYRVDYSSDPAHSFDPASYVLEFSTTVSPGQAQSLRIQGLQPNTTYFARIYLGDAGKGFAGASAPGSESTLANAPVDPAVVEVSSSHVIVSWTVPAWGARGYRSEGSTTNFGGLAPGGSTPTAQTGNGLEIRLTVTGLLTNSTYYLRVASLNSQGQPNYSAVVMVVTGGSRRPLSPQALLSGTNALRRSVVLDWTNPVYLDPTGVIVVLSTSPATTGIADGADYTAGQALPDGAVVKSTSHASSFVDVGLGLDTTYYYHLFSAGAGPVYSVSLTTSVFLDLPPVSPSGLTARPSADAASVTLTWLPVAANNDGSAFASTSSVRAVELDRYVIHRATSALRPGFVQVATVAATATSYTDVLPEAGRTYAYRVEAVDSYGTSDIPMTVTSGGDLYAVAPDGASHLKVSAELAAELAAAGVVIRPAADPPAAGEGSLRSVRFEAVRSGGGVTDRFEFSTPVTLSLAYEVANGRVVPADGGLLMAQAPAAGEAQGNLGLYWHNGAKYIKLYGKVDTANRTVASPVNYTGSYQIRPLQREQGFTFDSSGLSNKAITPNGDGLNDSAVFLFDNPKDSQFTGRVFDVRGALVAEMTAGPVRGKSLQWNGTSGGVPVRGGVYVYQIRAEDRVFTGTVLVIQ